MAVSQSYKYMDLTPEDGSSFIFFSFRAIAVFSPSPPRLFSS